MTVPLEEPEALDAETIQEDEKTAKVEAERTRPGLTMFTDESRLDSEATGIGTPSYGRMVNPGRASRPTWARIKKPTARSARH